MECVRVLLRAPLRVLKIVALLAWGVSGVLVLLTILQVRGVVAPELWAAVLGRATAVAPRAAASPLERSSRVPVVEAEFASGEEAPAAGRAFLGFRLPDDGFSPERRQRFEIIPALSRVGFDAATPIDTFSAISSDVCGFGEASPADPEAQPRGRLVVHTRSLSTGDAGRDRILHEGLRADRHPEIEFSVDSFETQELDLGSLALVGQAHCTMQVCGSEQRLTVPVKVCIDSRRQLTVEGEVALSLSAMGVEVGSTLGVPMISDEITMWFGIRARPSPGAAASLETTAWELAHAR